MSEIEGRKVYFARLYNSRKIMLVLYATKLTLKRVIIFKLHETKILNEY